MMLSEYHQRILDGTIRKVGSAPNLDENFKSACRYLERNNLMDTIEYDNSRSNDPVYHDDFEFVDGMDYIDLPGYYLVPVIAYVKIAKERS